MKEEQMKNLHSPETERHAAGHAYFIREYALLKKEVLKFEGGRKKGCRIPLKSGMRQAVNSDKTVPNKG